MRKIVLRLSAEVCAHRGGHRQPGQLNPAQEAAVVEEAAKGTFTKAEVVRRWMAHPKVPRPIHTKVDPEAQ